MLQTEASLAALSTARWKACSASALRGGSNLPCLPGVPRDMRLLGRPIGNFQWH